MKFLQQLRRTRSPHLPSSSRPGLQGHSPAPQHPIPSPKRARALSPTIIPQKLTATTSQMQQQAAALLSTGSYKMLMEQETAIKRPPKSSRDVL